MKLAGNELNLSGVVACIDRDNIEQIKSSQQSILNL